MPLLVALLILGATLYFQGWTPKAELKRLSGWIGKSGGVLIVFAAAMFVTRNVGIAIMAAVAYSIVTNSGAFRLGTESSKPKAGGAMAIEEAYSVLGLKPGASLEDVLNSYRMLMKKNHPDQGGSTYIASKLNEAKDLLARHLRV